MELNNRVVLRGLGMTWWTRSMQHVLREGDHNPRPRHDKQTQKPHHSLEREAPKERERERKKKS